MATNTVENDPILNGSILKSWRERMGFSEREACKQIGCSRNAWAGWEKDEQKIPRYIGLACAALALGMTPYGQIQNLGKSE